MPAAIKVLRMWDKLPDGFGVKVVSTVSKSPTAWERGLSPFFLGPCKLYDGHVARNMENGWQYSKVYPEFFSESRDKILAGYWDWAVKGWANETAVRYPMGKGRKPLFSAWNGERLSYIEARKEIYGPLYARAVLKTESYKQLRELYHKYQVLVLLDYDAYDHKKLGMSLSDVLNNPDKKMGHAFVLAMLLTMDDALGELETI